MITGLIKNNFTQKLATGAATLGVLAGVGMTTSPTEATTFSLGDLISNNGTITVGDKLFSNFSCTKSETGTPNCSDINVYT
jgi:hypothetical protein